MRHAAAFAGIPARLWDIHPSASAVTARQDDFIRARDFDRPTVVFDLEVMRDKYRALEAGLGDATIHYAIKANPAPEVVAAVAALGGHFDAASRGEIDLCLSLGVARAKSPSATPSSAPPTSPMRMPWAWSSSPSMPKRKSHKIAGECARRAGDHPHAGRGQPGRLAAQPQVRLLARARRCG